jgi:thymidylate kinase
MIRLDSKRWVVVNAERKWDEVQEELRKVIEAKIM